MMTDSKLAGHWKLKGDCRDYSGKGNHGINHGVNLARGAFNGRDAFIEVPDSRSLRLAADDFSLCAWVYTAKNLESVAGDIVNKYDPASRKGFNLSLQSSAGGYNSQGDDRHVHFGIDNARLGPWRDCGRPNKSSNYVSNSLTVYDGHLYAATTDAREKENWCRVYRYAEGKRWEDCGRVGNRRTTGVGPMIVHRGGLYAATWTYDWNRVLTGDYETCRVYRYEGGHRWKDCGQPGQNRRLNCIASFKGKLYVGGDDQSGGRYKVFVRESAKKWEVSATFPSEGSGWCYPHAMAVFQGSLYVGYPSVYAFDGKKWEYVGTPVGCTQMHSLEVYKGKLHAGTWPEGRVAFYKGGEDWEDCGRGGDSTEINALVVYNGKLYIGSIPRAEVFRYEGGRKWTRVKRFFDPPGWEPVSVGRHSPQEHARALEWTRVTSLTVYRGKLFAGIGSCTSAFQDAPCDLRGKVFCMEAGKNVTYDGNLGSGWKHITAVKKRGRLKLYVSGELKATSSPFKRDDYDLSMKEPLRIGMGEIGSFSGRISEVRLYARALDEEEIQNTAAEGPADRFGNLGDSLAS